MMEDYFDEFYMYDDDFPDGGDDDDDDDDDGDDDDDDGDGEVKYKWESNGGCPKCEDLARELHDEEPDPPHILCDCTVKEVKKGKNDKCKREYSVTVENQDSTHHGGPTFTITADYTVHCPDGTDISGTVEVEIEYDEYYSWFGGDPEDIGAMLINEILEEIDNDPENECEPCKDDTFPNS